MAPTAPRGPVWFHETGFSALVHLDDSRNAPVFLLAHAFTTADDPLVAAAMVGTAMTAKVNAATENATGRREGRT
jgi:hypothetical protein